MKKIATVVVGTKSYLKPMQACFRRIHTAIEHAKKSDQEHIVICVTDASSVKTVQSFVERFENKIVIPVDVKENGEHYKDDRQMMIATMQSIGFESARQNQCDLLWSVEADVLVPYNALSVSMQMLEFDDNYYDVAFVTYPSQGGGSFLGGHGDPYPRS